MNYERKVDVMDSLAGSTQSYYDEADSRRKRTRLIIAVVLIVLALAAAWYAFSSSKGGAAGANGAPGGEHLMASARALLQAAGLGCETAVGVATRRMCWWTSSKARVATWS